MRFGSRYYYACRVRYAGCAVQRLLQHCRRLPETAILNWRPLRVGVFRDEPLRARCVRHHNAPTGGGQRASIGHTQTSAVQNTWRADGQRAAQTRRTADAVRHSPPKALPRMDIRTLVLLLRTWIAYISRWDVLLQ